MLGCSVDEEGAAFEVWAPFVKQVVVVFEGASREHLRLVAAPDGYHRGRTPQDCIGVRYWLELDGQRRRPDPASRFQPEGLSGPSQVVDLRRDWRDPDWRGLPLHDYILYELHVGCFSPTHDFLGVQRRLDRLVELGVTAIELLPVAQFPGSRNWGYDGALLYAAQHSYGGPHALQDLVEACHARGLAVVLDVVYNHLGPEGNYLAEFGPYFTDRYHTPWGHALNFDGSDSDDVRRFFIENACYWIRDFHIDALRLDAIQMIFDTSAKLFLTELTEAVHAVGEQQGRTTLVIGETHQNDARQITETRYGGVGLDAVWSNDFHHALHARLTGERMSVFQDFGSGQDLAGAVREGFLYQGQYSRRFRRKHGSPVGHLPQERLVIFAQNHDQIGNRLYGDRLNQLVSRDQLQLAAALLLLAPQTPMLYMGEEYGEPAPFLYFVDHESPRLRKQVRQGRLRDFHAFIQPSRKTPDPAHKDTFTQSVLQHRLALESAGKQLWDLHRDLIKLRKQLYARSDGKAPRVETAWNEEGQWMTLSRDESPCRWRAVFSLSEQECEAPNPLPHPGGEWSLVLANPSETWDPAEPTWRLKPWSFAVFTNDA